MHVVRNEWNDSKKYSLTGGRERMAKVWDMFIYLAEGLSFCMYEFRWCSEMETMNIVISIEGSFTGRRFTLSLLKCKKEETLNDFKDKIIWRIYEFVE